jgi:hypothetical protein
MIWLLTLVTFYFLAFGKVERCYFFPVFVLLRLKSASLSSDLLRSCFRQQNRHHILAEKVLTLHALLTASAYGYKVG